MINMRFRQAVVNALVLALLGSLSACREKPKAAPAGPPKVEVVALQQRDVPIYREWVGTLAGEVNASITPQVSGYLLSRDYQEGSAVTNGQVLFQIDPRPFQAALDQARAKVTQAKATRDKFALDVQRYRPLAATEAISKQELDDAIQNEKTAQGEVDAAEAAVQQTALNLGFATIRSPLNGIAGLASVAAAQIGNLIGPSSGPLTTVESVHPMRVYFSVSQDLVTQMQERRLAAGKSAVSTNDGPELQLTLAGGYVYPVKGRVRFANNQVDVKTGTVTVVGEFANPDRLLVPGMFVRVRALLETQKDALLVPQRAVTDMQGRYLLAVVGADNKISVRPVNAGERVGTDWVVTGDLKAGERIVAEGVQKIRNGEVVNPVSFVAPSPAAKAAGNKE
jgi:membrane fusion protein, multidrug efflux system